MVIDNNQFNQLEGSKITICAGWFDLFHVGHLHFLQAAKTHTEQLLVVVMNDADGKTAKDDSRPIIPENQRAEILDNLKCVDFTLISPKITHPIKYPQSADRKTLLLWDRYIPLIERLRPRYVFALEETLKGNGLGDYIQSLGIKVIYTDRFPEISTTEITRKLKQT